MIVDTSALVALVLREPGHERIEAVLAAAEGTAIGAPALVELGIVLSVRLGRDARPVVSRLLKEASIVVLPFTEAHHSAAMSAWLRFGKGRHPAALNYGDCLSYAAAKVAGQPLLCVGEDFRRTDVEIVGL